MPVTIDPRLVEWLESLPDDERTGFLLEAEAEARKQISSALPPNLIDAARVLGVTLWSDLPDFAGPDKLSQIMDHVQNGPSRFTVVESGHGVGKTFDAAAVAAAWLERYKPAAKVVTLAPTHVQVNAILWNYIRKFHNAANLTPDIFETPNWKIGPECFAIGLSPRKASADDLQALHGYHSPNLLIIMDEAPGLPRLMWEAIRGLVTGENNRILALGNPLEQAGPFWEACVGGTWNYINISCLDHPNVVLGRDAIPGAVSRAWVDEMVRDHCTPAAEGEAGAIEWGGRWWQPDGVFMSRVLGKAPTEATDQLISLAWVSDAQTWVAEPAGYEPVILGMDCSRVTHGDSSTIVARRGPQVLWVKRRKIQSANPGREMAGWLAEEYRLLGASKAYVEETGVGTTVVDSARAIGVPVVAVSPGAGASSRNMANLRAEMWWRMREALQQRALSLPQDDMLAADLCAPKYYYDGGARIILEPKDKIRGRLGRSPDSGDALATTFAHEGVTARHVGDAVRQVKPVASKWAIGGAERRGPGREGRGSRWRV